MTIKYCDFVNGNDSTGNGSYSNPYKTIDIASTGLTGGDEVRVAKSPDNVTLTGTLDFIVYTATVTGTNTLFSTELSIGDTIIGADGYYYDVLTISSDTSITLYKRYTGSTQSGATVQKLGYTSTGTPAASSTNVQSVSSSGSSPDSKLLITGGWDLSTQTQTGVTNFKCIHNTITYRYGRGLYFTGKSYVKTDKLSFLRYDLGMYFYAINTFGNEINNANCSNCGTSGISIATNATYITLNNCICHGCGTQGFYCTSTCNNIINNGVAGGATYGVLFASASGYNVVNGIIARYCADAVGFVYAYGNVINNLDATSNSFNVSSQYSIGNVINKLVNAVSNMNISGTSTCSEIPLFSIQDFNNVIGDHRMYYDSGMARKDGTNGVKFTPTSANIYIGSSFNFAVDGGSGQTLSFKTQKDADYNGDMQVAVFFNGLKIVDWVTVTPTGATGFEDKSVAVTSDLVTEDGVLELRVRARGTAGNCWVNSLSVS